MARTQIEEDPFDVDETPCPACGEFPDYCLGHGEMADVDGRRILHKHDSGDHSECHDAAGCG